MRIAIISDVHANHEALAAFQEYLFTQSDIDVVLNAGDLINIGPRPRETAEGVLDQPKFISIMGNNEEMLTNAATSDGGTNRHRRWTFARLPEDLRERLEKLPKSWTGQYDGVRFFMTHSRPGNSNVFPLLYDKHDIQAFVKDYEAIDAQVIVFGHTHEPFLLRHQGRLFINPGSLGLSRDDRAPFAVATIERGRVDVEFRSVQWNRESFAMDYVVRDVPDKEFILDHFFGINSLVSL